MTARLDGQPRADKGSFRKYASPEEKQIARRAQQKAARDRYNEKHKDRRREKRRAYLKANPHISRAASIKWYHNNKDKILARRYGLTEEEYAALPKACEICGTRERLCVDHCHGSGKVRGRLCEPCNSALGMLREDVDRFHAAVAYLEKHRAK